MGYSEPATYFRCSDGTDAFQAFPLGKLGCSYSLKTQFMSFTRSVGTVHMQDMEKWHFLNVDACASVLLFLISQGWCWGPHSAVIQECSQLLLICRPAHCLGTFDAWKTSWLNGRSWVQQRGWGPKSRVVIFRAGLWLGTRGSIRGVYQCPSLSRHCSFCYSLSPKERVQTCVREQNCSCLQEDRFGSSVCLILTFTSNF